MEDACTTRCLHFCFVQTSCSLLLERFFDDPRSFWKKRNSLCVLSNLFFLVSPLRNELARNKLCFSERIKIYFCLVMEKIEPAMTNSFGAVCLRCHGSMSYYCLTLSVVYFPFRFPNLGIQCCKKRDVAKSLKQRLDKRVDPYDSKYSCRVIAGVKHNNPQLKLLLISTIWSCLSFHY